MENHKLNLTISSANGDWEDNFPNNQPVHALKTRAIAHFHMDPSQADQFILTYDGLTLDESRTLAELGIPDGAIIILERKDVTKI